MTLGDLVSVVIPVFNRADMLREALESVAGQTYRPVEVVVVDDGSSFPHASDIERIVRGTAIRCLLVRADHRGPGSARNLGLQHSQGEFIQYLDSDDLLEPRKLELQVEALREHPWAGVAYGRTTRVNAVTAESRTWARTGERIDDIFPSFLVKRGWDTNSPLWRRDVCEAIGPWLHLHCMEDWEHDLRAGLLGVKPVRVDAHVATVRDHESPRASGMTTGLCDAMLQDMYTAHRSIAARILAEGHDPGAMREPFARKLFWLARELADRSMNERADECLELAALMSRSTSAAVPIGLFRIGKLLLGWRGALGFGSLLRRHRAASGAVASS